MSQSKRNESVVKLVLLASFLDSEGQADMADRIDNVIKDSFKDPAFFDEALEILNKDGFLDKLLTKYDL